MKTVIFIPKLQTLRVLIGILVTTATSLYAATITVTNTTDNVASPAVGSLRGAIAAAADGDTIEFAPAVTGTITLAGAELVLDKSLTISGPGAATLALSGNQLSRVFTIPTGKTVSLSGLTVRGGKTVFAGVSIPAGDGGGILNAGTLALTDCIMTANQTSGGGTVGGNGGGIANSGSLTMNGCVVSSNVAKGGSFAGGNGGGIYNSGTFTGSNLTVSDNHLSELYSEAFGPKGNGGGMFSSTSYMLSNSTISGNRAANVAPNISGTVFGGSGGGIYGDGTCVNCTFTNNQTGYSSVFNNTSPASGAGGAISGNVTLTSCTVVGNTVGQPQSVYESVSPGGGVSGSGTLRNCIIAGNIAHNGFSRILGGGGGTPVPATGFDLSGSFTSAGHNLIGKIDGSTGIVAGTNGDLAGTIAVPLNPLVSAFGANGGPTETFLLASGSPALDAGDDTLTGTDQRGFPRPIGSHVDMGAVETDTSIVAVVSFLAGSGSVGESDGSMAVIVRRTGNTASAVSVGYTTTAGSALSGSDFTATSGTLSFAAEEMEKTIQIAIVDDPTVEFDETFQIGLSSPSGCVLGAFPIQVATITKNDSQEVRFSAVSSSVAESDGNAVITVIRTGAIGSVSVTYSTIIDGTATSGSDFTATSGTLTFAQGESQKTISVPILNDATMEVAETFTLELYGLDVIAPSSHTVTIESNDLPGPIQTIQFSAAASTVSEATANVLVTIVRSETAGSVSISYSTTGVTAVAGSDFSTTTGTVTFADGVAQQTIAVPIVNDAAVEGDETFSVQLSSPTNGTELGAIATHTVTIQSDDAAPPAPQVAFLLASSAVPESGGNAVITVRRTVTLSGAIAVSYATSSGSAIAGSDFTESSGVLNFAAFETERIIVVPIATDAIAEGDETFTVTLSAPTGGATLGSGSGHIVTITGAPTLALASNMASVGENAGAVSVHVVRTGSTTGSVSVQYSTSPGTASGADYTATSGTLTFGPGVMQQTITVPILTDALIEGNETFTVNLASPTEALLGATTSAEVTISDVVPARNANFHGLANRRATAGLGGIVLKTTVKNRVTGKLQVNGLTYAFSGPLDEAGALMEVFSVKVSRVKVQRTLTLQRSNDGLAMNGTFTLEDGTIYDIAADADALDEQAVSAYNALLTSGNLRGFARSVVKTSGVVSIKGCLPDGRAFTHSSHIAANGNVAIFVPLYARERGYLGGTANIASGKITALLSWEKPPKPGSVFSGGFDDQSLTLSGALYTFTAGQRVLSEFDTTNGTGNAHFTGGGLASEFVLPLTYSTDNKIAFPQNAALKLVPATGRFKGWFKDSGGVRHSVEGIVVPGEDADIAEGYFINGSTSGTVKIVAD